VTRKELITRLEAATAEQQAGLIKVVLWYAVDNMWITLGACGRAIRMVDAEAYESAAMTLVAEGSFLDLYGPDRTTGMYCAELPVADSDAAFLGRSQVGLAIAICIAALFALGDA